jgi:competence protein ComEA
MADRPANIPRGTATALLIVLGGIGGVTGFELYHKGKSAEADIIITGTPRPTDHPAKRPGASTALPAPATQQPAVGPAVQTKVTVHVAGAVAKPGVYHLTSDSRVEDALKAAGGSRQGANLDAINLAAKLEDGSQLFVPTKLEQPSGGVSEGSSKYTAALSKTASEARTSGHSGTKFSQPGKESVNINTATAEQLQHLPGVGPAMSARIMQHRKESGPFTDPEQLMDVSGIGEKKFAKMKPFVRVR